MCPGSCGNLTILHKLELPVAQTCPFAGDSTVGPGRITELLKSTQIDSVYFDCIATQVQGEGM